ncbi:trypsin-like peptidase domain-containing protein [Nannocystis radixulma]|uniref:Trypsin-like peptidase domain-containing protein n=1 Tax=Nannocystis radixulma TaxID=2995305 RepID=A0ABT5BIP0_9BACT|nr:trypsin-like peptidase domain-containing protein [Nannocystis radixulma]MDC0672907.1 trypsin-like peptidase domain-containing protein [Nannocystis radixulma]
MRTKNLSLEVPFLQNPEESPDKVVMAIPDNIASQLAIGAETGLRMRAFRKRAELRPATLEGLKIDLPPSTLEGPKVEDLIGRAEVPLAMLDELRFENIIGRDNLLPACFLKIGAERARSVCLVSTSGTNYKGERGSWRGTGFMISPNILVTNHHVLHTMEAARAATFEFGYEVDEDGNVGLRQTFTADPNRLFVTSSHEHLDYTFVWLDGEPGTLFGVIPATRAQFELASGDFANIIQHAHGGPKMISLQENNICHHDLRVLHYSSDTEDGSSGSPIFNNTWNLIGLHHAARRQATGSYINEGLTFSAIATDLERRVQAGEDAADAREVLAAFTGVDPLLGFFGGLGRTPPSSSGELESVETIYRGEADDIDVGFWNVEWFCKNYREKLDVVAQVILSMNLDVWALSESSFAATEALVEHLRTRYKAVFEFAASEPNAGAGKQALTVMWNPRTVKGEKLEWPAELEEWFAVRSEDFDELALESVDGKVFDRYPALYQFSVRNRDRSDAFVFNLVPVHLKARDEGSKRRQMASKILAAAVQRMIDGHGAPHDWLIGGDFNATLASEDFAALSGSGMVPLSVQDEEEGGFSYVARPKSLIDHIFVSPNLARIVGPEDFFIVARDRELPEFVEQISDHRPVLVRLSLGRPRPEAASGRGKSLPQSLVAALRR